MNKSELLSTLKSYEPELKEKFGIEQLALFGSYATDTQTDNSDIDLLIIKMKTKNAFTLLKAKQYLSNIFHKDIDLGLLDSLRPFIKKRVLKDLIYV